MNRSLRFLFVLATVALVAGCAKSYVITQPLATALTAPSTIAIGAIADELPVDMEASKKPTQEDIVKLQNFLRDEIDKKKLGQLVAATANPQYEVQGSFLEFKRGSGAVRFFIGFGLGNAKAVIVLRLVDKNMGGTVFAGNFTGAVSSGMEGGEQALRRIASDFAKALQKELKTAKSVS